MKIITLILATTTAVLISSAPSFAQDMEHMDSKSHREIMPKHEMMKQMQKAQDEEIDKLVAKMNSTHGEERIDAIVAVINKLIEQRKVMHDKMAAMHD